MRKTIFYILLFFSLNIFGQKFIVLDTDTYDLIDSVTFILYNDDKIVYTNVTKNNSATVIPSNIKYNKIEFIKTGYKTSIIKMENLNEPVFLTKEYIRLDDVVVSSKKNEYIILGESNRIRHSRSRLLMPELTFGTIFHNYKNNLNINHTIFYVDKVKYKTAYKIHFFEVEESLPFGNLQTLQFNQNIYSTDTLYLNSKQKNRIEIEHKEDILFKENTKLFVYIEALYYLDENDKKILPKNKDRTKLKFQLSNENNYYSKTFNTTTSEQSANLTNSNLRIKYDFANYLFKTPHKRILLTPAILLNTTEIK
ncbi:hypothetical protein [uncultured Mesonia sp.]|uniref:hypothetical protein n=1 Tax=uncultured Mesonia sp. TaxID=399731 RepID=UPI00374E5588